MKNSQAFIHDFSKTTRILFLIKKVQPFPTIYVSGSASCREVGHISSIVIHGDNFEVLTFFNYFISHVITNKKRNNSINKFKNLGNDGRLQYKEPRQGSSLCCFSFARYSQKCVTQIYKALYGGAIFVPFGGAQTWRP